MGTESTERELGGGLRLVTAALRRAVAMAQEAPRGGQGATKRLSRWLLFGHRFLMPLRIDFLWIWGANMAPSWPPKSTKIHEKSMPRGFPKLSSFFDRFLIDFYSQLRPLEPSKSLFILRKNKVFSKNRLSKLASILGGHLNANLAPFCFQNPSKSFKNPIPRGIQQFIDFGFDF